MPRHTLLAGSFFALAIAVAPPVAAQQSNVYGPLGHVMEVASPNGGNATYATTLPKPPDMTFQALQVVYANFKIPATTLDPDGHVIGTTNWTTPHWLAGHELSRYFDCGSGRGQSADELSVKLTIRSTVVSDSTTGQSVLRTLLSASGTSQIEMGRPMSCQTSGQLETRISDEVMKLLNK
jgi:hypothetical protein